MRDWRFLFLLASVIGAYVYLATVFYPSIGPDWMTHAVYSGSDVVRSVYHSIP